jgi:hypothetical protein
MRMSRGRSDGESINQSEEVLRAHASLRQPSIESNYYNRLEYRRCVRLLYATTSSIDRSFSAPPQPVSLLARGQSMQLSKPQAFLSLLQVRESCHKQFRGVTLIRRGIA